MSRVLAPQLEAQPAIPWHQSKSPLFKGGNKAVQVRHSTITSCSCLWLLFPCPRETVPYSSLLSRSSTHTEHQSRARSARLGPAEPSTRHCRHLGRKSEAGSHPCLSLTLPLKRREVRSSTFTLCMSLVERNKFT